MARNGKDHSGIAYNGFEHTLRTNEAKERFANEVKQPLTLAEMIAQEKKDKEARELEALKPKEKVEEKPRFGNVFYEDSVKQRELFKQQNAGKAKKCR